MQHTRLSRVLVQVAMAYFQSTIIAVEGIYLINMLLLVGLLVEISVNSFLTVKSLFHVFTALYNFFYCHIM